MTLLPRLVAVLLLTVAVGGCSHGTVGEIPTAPTTVVRISSLRVTPVGGGTVIEGTIVPVTSSGGFPSTGATLGAFAQYTDGSGKYVPAIWTSSDPNIVTIDGEHLTAKARGTVTITAAAEGMTASETFIVQGGIAGTWSGTYLVEQCDAGSGSMYELICFPPNQGRTPGVLAVGARPPMTLVITQSGTDLQAIAQFGELRGTLTGSDRGQNFLTLQGNVTVNATTVSLVYWNARVVGDSMEGLIGLEVRIAGLPSHAQVVARIDKVTRR